VWIVTLSSKGRLNKLIFDNMTHSALASYLRYHRKRSGLSQREMAQLLGYPDQEPVSRHERSRSMPPLTIALCYQAIFRVPVSDLFPGHYEKTLRVIDERLAKMEHDLQQCSARDRGAAMIAHKLEWMWERKTQRQSNLIHESEPA
jgi:DNA-binding XRE family transcriptional regulator